MPIRLFELLMPRLIQSPEAITLLLENADTRWTACRLLKDIGTKARRFSGRLFELLNDFLRRDADHYDGGISAALGSVDRGNPALVDALLAWIGQSDRHTWAAYTALRFMEGEVAGRNAELVANLMPSIIKSDDQHCLIAALASIGRNDPAVRRFVIDRARPRSSPLISSPHDLTNVRQGDACEAMAHLLDFPEECLPTLIEAIPCFHYAEDYEDGLNMPASQMLETLSKFGATATCAALPLVRTLNAATSPDDYFPLWKTLHALGPGTWEARKEVEAYAQNWDPHDWINEPWPPDPNRNPTKYGPWQTWEKRYESARSKRTPPEQPTG